MEMDPNVADSISQFLTSKGYIAIPFRQNVAGQLLINASINGVEGVYILDTGAGQTVVDDRLVDKLHLKLNRDEALFTGGGVGAHGIENIPSYNNTLEINNYRIDNLVVAVMSLESAWEALAGVGAHDNLFGIIGFDILKPANAIIDYSNMTLYLMQPHQ